MILFWCKVFVVVFWLVVIVVILVFVEGDEVIYVVKDFGCFCCNGWIGYLCDSGFWVFFEECSIEEFVVFKCECGILEDFVFCYIVIIGDYIVEGYVFVVDICCFLVE